MSSFAIPLSGMLANEQALNVIFPLDFHIGIHRCNDCRFLRFTAFQQFWGDQPNPPTITGIYVSGLAHPDFLVEMDAIAVVPV